MRTLALLVLGSLVGVVAPLFANGQPSQASHTIKPLPTKYGRRHKLTLLDWEMERSLRQLDVIARMYKEDSDITVYLIDYEGRASTTHLVVKAMVMSPATDKELQVIADAFWQSVVARFPDIDPRMFLLEFTDTAGQTRFYYGTKVTKIRPPPNKVE